MPNVMVEDSIASVYVFCPTVLGRMVRPREERMGRESTCSSLRPSARSATARSATRGAAAAVEGRGTVDGLGGHGLAGAGQLDQGAHDVHAPAQRLLGAAQGDLVTAHVDVGVGHRVLESGEGLVVLPQHLEGAEVVGDRQMAF